MPIEQLLSSAGFILVMVGTPGPNNLMLMASGVNFGIRRSLPLLAGIVFGCQALLLAAAFGLAQLLTLYPEAMVLLRVFCALFLLYMAWLLVSSKAAGDSAGPATRPMTFWQATLFQWVNPKAWMICLALIAVYAHPASLVETTARASLVLLVVGTPIMLAWNIGGLALRYWLRQGARLRWFNRIMALLLLGSVYPMMV